MWFTYLLLCDNKSFYVGITNNISNRLSQHRNKLTISTKEYLKTELVYCERYASKREAAKREKQLKGWSKAKKQMLIDGKLGINACAKLVEVLRGERSLS
jgi:putative endonuclease